MSEDMVMMSGRIPEDLKALVDADPRDNQEVLRSALWREFGGERKGALERRIEEKERRISMIESEKEQRENELQEERRELEALQSKLDEKVSEENQLLNEAEEALSRIPNPTVDNTAVQNWADKCDMEPSELLDKVDL